MANNKIIAENLWTYVRDQLKEQLSTPSFDTWIDPLEVVDMAPIVLRQPLFSFLPMTFMRIG